MFVFQSWKNRSDFAAWDTQTAKKNEKVLSDPVAWLVKDVIAPFSKNEKGMQCIAHYLNASGESLRLNLTKPEWEFILKQTKQDWFKSNLRDDLMKYDSRSLKEELKTSKETPMSLATSRQNLPDFRKALKEAGFAPNMTNADVRKILTLKEGEKMYLTLEGISLDVNREGGKLALSFPPKGMRFYERMKREGIDLDKMEGKMKIGEKKEFVDKDGRPYLVVKEKAMGGGDEASLRVYYNRKWLPPAKDGWERMHMVPGGVNSTDMTANVFTDTWNALGFTTVARKKNKEGGYDYKIEEQFGFAGSRSANQVLYNRIVPNSVGKQIKKHFPGVSVHPVEGKDGNCEVMVNSTWMSTVGKEFQLIIDGARTGKDGKLHVKGEEPPPGSAFYGMR